MQTLACFVLPVLMELGAMRDAAQLPAVPNDHSE
jgi:hypothetical protein